MLSRVNVNKVWLKIYFENFLIFNEELLSLVWSEKLVGIIEDILIFLLVGGYNEIVK